MSWMAPRLYVQDVKSSLSFYQEVLGFQVWFSDAPRAAGISFGSGRVILQQEETGKKVEQKGAGFDLYFGMTEIDAYYEKVSKQANVVEPLVTTPWNHRLFTVADSDGFKITFSQEL